MVVGLTVVAIFIALVYEFRQLIGPLLLAFIVAYLLQPLASRLNEKAKLTWRGAVNLIYLVVLVVLVILILLAGYEIIQQVQSLYTLVQDFTANLPGLLDRLSTQEFVFGPLRLDMKNQDLIATAEQVLGAVQPMFGRVGSGISVVASGAATSLGWIVFVVLVSYYLLADRGKTSIARLEIPGYSEDLKRLAHELERVWNAFLRGQMVIIIIVVVYYTLLMTILGVRYAVAIAILAGIARLLPYIGAFTSNLVTALVAFFQASNYYAMEPWKYTALVIALVIVADQIMDNIVVPRLMGESLGIPPAAILVAAIIAFNWLGLIGLVIAAPVLATLLIVGRYIVRKMFDQDPWPEPQSQGEIHIIPWARVSRGMRLFWENFLRRK